MSLIFDILNALTLVLITLLINIWFKNKIQYHVYILMFLGFLAIVFLFKSEAHAQYESHVSYTTFEIDRYEDLTSHAQKTIEDIKNSLLFRGHNLELSKQDREFYQKKVEFHNNNCKRTFEDAKRMCWYLPNQDYREFAKKCFIAFCAGLAPGSPVSKMITAMTATLAQYGLECMDEWHDINNKLYWSKYHAEMSEFYQDLLNGIEPDNR